MSYSRSPRAVRSMTVGTRGMPDPSAPRGRLAADRSHPALVVALAGGLGQRVVDPREVVAESSTSAAPMFSSRCERRFVPGIGTTSSPWASTQASASWPACTPFSAASSSTSRTSSRLRSKFSPWKRGEWRRKSSGVEVLDRPDRARAGTRARAASRRRSRCRARAASAGPPSASRASTASTRSAAPRSGATACARRIVSGRRLAESPSEADLARLDELGHRADGLLDRRVGVDAVLVVEVDVVGRPGAAASPRRPGARTPGGRRRRGAVGSSRSRTMPNFVASTTSSRRPSIARPTSSSFVAAARTCRRCRGTSRRARARGGSWRSTRASSARRRSRSSPCSRGRGPGPRPSCRARASASATDTLDRRCHPRPPSRSGADEALRRRLPRSRRLRPRPSRTAPSSACSAPTAPARRR